MLVIFLDFINIPKSSLHCTFNILITIELVDMVITNPIFLPSQIKPIYIGFTTLLSFISLLSLIYTNNYCSKLKNIILLLLIA